MTIEIHRYRLRSRFRLNALTSKTEFEGALVRIDGGYGCLHPWPTLGDLPLEAQLDALRTGRDTDLTRQTRHCCAIDGAARREGRWLFDHLTIPPSHAIAGSLPDEEMTRFPFIKVKDASRLDELAARFPEARFRLDFNESLTESEFERFLESAPLERIDLVEDPMPYAPAVWARFNDKIPIAIDRDTSTGIGYQFRVIKPARQSVPDENTPFIVTSYMDHPLGQLFAAWQATQIEVYGCGLLTHLLFEKTAFSEQLAIKEETLIPPRGTGLGFDELLEKLDWRRL